MAATKKNGNAGRRTTSNAKQTKTATAKAPAPTALATRVKPVKTVPTSPVVRSKTLANGEPRPKSRRSK